MPDPLTRLRNRWDNQFDKILDQYGLGSMSPSQIGSVLFQPLQAQAEAEVLQDDLMDQLTAAYGQPIITPEDQTAAAYALTQERRWGAIDENLAKLSPETADYLARYSPSERQTAIYNKAFSYLNQFYGDEYMAAFLNTALSKNPDTQDETMRVLESFANQQVMAEGSSYIPAQADPNYHIDPELLQEVLADPTKFETLSTQDKLEVQAASRQALDAVDPEALYSGATVQADPNAVNIDAGNVQEIIGFLNTGKYKIALDRDELRKLDSINFAGAEGAGVGGVANLNDSSAPGENKLPEDMRELGLISLSGRGEGQFRMDEEWVRQNPVKAVAVIERMKMNFPGVQVNIGKSGFVGDVFEYFGMPVDFIGGAVGATGQQFNELMEQWTGSDEDRLKAANQALDLKTRLANNDVRPDEVEDITNQIRELEDAATVQVGLQEWKNDQIKAITGEVSGAGFTPGLLEGFGYMPGDQGYGLVSAITTLVGNIAFDPLTYGSSILKAGTLARDIPRTADDIPKVTKSILTQTIYRQLAKTPEELVATRPYQKALSRIWDSKEAADDIGVWETKLMEQFNVSPDVARTFSRSKSLEDLQLSFIRAMTGPNYKAGAITDVAKRMRTAERELQRLNALPEQIAALKRQLAAYKGVRTKQAQITAPAGELTEVLEFPGRATVDELGGMRGRTVEQTTDLRNSMAGGYDETLGGKIVIEYHQPSGTAIIREGHHRVGIGAETNMELPIEVVPVNEPIQSSLGINIDEVRDVQAEQAARGGLSDAAEAAAQEDFARRLFGAAGDDVDMDALAGLSELSGTQATGFVVQGNLKSILDDAVNKGNVTNENIVRLENELNQVETVYTSSAHTKLDTVAEYLWAKSVYEGRDWTRPITGLPSAGSVRRLYDPKDLGAFERAWLSASEMAGNSGLGMRTLERIGAKRLLNHLQTKEGQAQEAVVREFFARNQHWVLDSPRGEQIFFPSTTMNAPLARMLERKGIKEVTQGTIDELAQQSFGEISNFYKLLGHNDEAVARLMNGWSDIGTSKAKAYKWWTESWEAAIEESPLLTRASKDELGRMWNNVSSERGPGFMLKKNKSKRGTTNTYEDTLYEVKPDPNNPGEYIETPTPGFHPDMLQTYRIPSYKEMIKHLSFTQRTLASMKKGGLGRKIIANSAMGVGVAWSSGVNLWKNIVLLGKMPVSLPMRIWTEEMLRMASFDYASALRNPWEWWRSLTSKGEFDLFAESPTGLLGTLDQQLKQAHGGISDGKAIYSLAEAPEPYFRAMAGLTGHRVSKETKYLLKYMNDPKALVKLLDENPNLVTPGWLEHIDEIVGTDLPGQIPNRLEAIKRLQTELKDIIGTGPESGKIRSLLENGKVEIDGAVYQAGSSELAPVLAELQRTNKWQPNVPVVSAHYAEALPMKGEGTLETMRRAADWMYSHFYSKADTWAARSPLFRQIAAREYSRWTTLGYTTDAAKELAFSRAAEKTRDLMFEIGAHSPSEVTIKSLMPFFPAWRELATTWLARVPRQFGGGKWAVGSVIFANRVNDYLTFLQETGLVGKNENGDWVAPNPIGGVLNIFFGEDLVHEINAESLAGLLPVPGLQENPDENASLFNKLKGFAPTFGAPASIVVGKAGDAWGGIFKDISDTMTFYGADTSLGPAALDRMLEAAGYTPFWMTESTRQMHEAQRQWAIIDGLKIEIAQNPPPPVPDGVMEDPKIQQQYYNDYNAWLETALGEAEEFATTSYVFKGAISALSPVAMGWESQQDKEYEALRGFLENVPGDALDAPMLEVYKHTYPGAYAYITSKTIDLHPDLGQDVNNLEEFRNEVLTGMREQLTPAEWARYSYGMNSFFIYLNQKSLAYKELGSTPGDVLSHGYEKNQIDELDASWESFLDLQSSLPTEDGGRDFAQLFDIWQEAHNSGPASISLEQQYVLDLKQRMGNVAQLMSPNQRDDLDWGNAQSALSETLGNVDIKSTSYIGKGISKWWDKVGTPYLEDTSKIWDEISRTEKALRGPLYEKLRAVENEYYTTYKLGKFGTMPSPQEAFFSNLSPDQQDQRLKEMAALPVSFLNEFYREKLGFNTGNTKKMNELASFLNTAEDAFDERIIRSGISTSSKEYEIYKNRFEAAKLEKAQSLGLAEEYKLWTAPTYVRMDAAFDLSQESLLWQNVKGYVDQITKGLERVGYSAGGQSEAAQILQKALFDKIDQYRDIDKDNFDKIMESFEKAYGESGRPLVGRDMYMKLFFDYFGDSAPQYLYVR